MRRLTDLLDDMLRNFRSLQLQGLGQHSLHADEHQLFIVYAYRQHAVDLQVGLEGQLYATMVGFKVNNFRKGDIDDASIDYFKVGDKH